MSNLGIIFFFSAFFILINNFWCLFLRKSELKHSAAKVKMCVAFSLKALGRKLKGKKEVISLRSDGGGLCSPLAFKWGRPAADFLPYYFFLCLLVAPPAVHSQKLVCQTDPFLMNCLLENHRNHWQAVVRLQEGSEGCYCSLEGERGPSSSVTLGEVAG